MKTPLHYVTTRELAERLIEEGYSVNERDEYGLIPLYYALESGNKELATFLRYRGGETGDLCLHYVACTGDIDEAKKLLDEEGDVKLKVPKWKTTPLHISAINGQVAVAELLILKGADVNAGDWLDWTPLHYAVSKGKIIMAKMLVENGGDVNMENASGKKPIDLSEGKVRDILLDLFSRRER